VESGYFAPLTSQVPPNGKATGKPQDVNVYAHNKQLLELNTPVDYIRHIPLFGAVPQFFLAAGAEDAGDVQGAEYFRQLLLLRVADSLPVDIVSGAGHQAKVWRSALTPMLEWMTVGLAEQVQQFNASASACAHHRTPSCSRHVT
jgi:hypothetical protein